MKHLSGVCVASRHHLREVDEGEPLLLVDEKVELVEVAVDEAVPGQADDHLHAVPVDHVRVPHLAAPQLVHGVPLGVAHENNVPFVQFDWFHQEKQARTERHAAQQSEKLVRNRKKKPIF